MYEMYEWLSTKWNLLSWSVWVPHKMHGIHWKWEKRNHANRTQTAQAAHPLDFGRSYFRPLISFGINLRLVNKMFTNKEFYPIFWDFFLSQTNFIPQEKSAKPKKINDLQCHKSSEHRMDWICSLLELIKWKNRIGSKQLSIITMLQIWANLEANMNLIMW